MFQDSNLPAGRLSTLPAPQQTPSPSGHCYCHHIRPLKGLEESQHLSVCPIVGVQNHQIHNQVTTVVAFSHPSTIGPIIPFSGTIMSMPHGCMVSGCVETTDLRPLPQYLVPIVGLSRSRLSPTTGLICNRHRLEAQRKKNVSDTT